MLTGEVEGIPGLAQWVHCVPNLAALPFSVVPPSSHLVWLIPFQLWGDERANGILSLPFYIMSIPFAYTTARVGQNLTIWLRTV